MFKKVALLTVTGLLVAVAGLVSTLDVQASDTTNCIDGSKSSNIKYSWSGADQITVSTKSGKAVCKDTTLFFSSFVMPSTWDGKGWNKTAVPQTHYASVSETFKAGKKDQKFVMKLNLDKCKNMQVDLYYSPKQGKVDWNDKIGERLITAKHVKGVKCEPPVKDIKVCELATKKVVTIKENNFDSKKHSKNLDDCKVVIKNIEVCELTTKEIVTIKETDFDASKHSKNLGDCKVVTPEEPEEPEVPEQPEEPAGEGEVDEPEVPAELPKTGLSTSFLTVLLGALGTYATVYRLRK